MHILNYDRGKEPSSFKQLYGFVPKNVFRMLICGACGCGKTNLLMHILLKLLICYDKIYLYSKQLQQDKYRNLVKEFKEISNEVGYPIIEFSNWRVSSL